MNTETKAYSLIHLGFNDYIAARHLINGAYILQGVTLASTAVEKYLKVVLVSKGKTNRDIRVHLDKIEKLKNQLRECYVDFTNEIDDRFLEILGKAYQARYYDDIKEPITIGFFVNQFLCELDYTVELFENKIFKDIKDDQGNQILTPYKRYIQENNHDLILNNYLFSGLSKKDFMEQPDKGFCIYINPEKWNGNFLVEAHDIINTYEGKIASININFTNKK